mmetsp:Transcript_14517/g.22167  ORF Transcript_14517/g.22167 Transcript_14517/m.22167 type:complete len:95 (-) Transcript_14517:20-304(-)
MELPKRDFLEQLNISGGNQSKVAQMSAKGFAPLHHCKIRQDRFEENRRLTLFAWSRPSWDESSFRHQSIACSLCRAFVPRQKKDNYFLRKKRYS